MCLNVYAFVGIFEEINKRNEKETTLQVSRLNFSLVKP